MQLGRVQPTALQPGERKGAEEQQLKLGQDVGDIVGIVRIRPRQQRVERLLREGANHDAQGRCDAHGKELVLGRVGGLDLGVVGVEREERDLDTRVVEHTRGGEEQDEPNPVVVLR